MYRPERTDSEPPKASERTVSLRSSDMEMLSFSTRILEHEGSRLMRKVAEEELLRLSQALMVKEWVARETSESG